MAQRLAWSGPRDLLRATAEPQPCRAGVCDEGQEPGGDGEVAAGFVRGGAAKAQPESIQANCIHPVAVTRRNAHLSSLLTVYDHIRPQVVGVAVQGGGMLAVQILASLG